MNKLIYVKKFYIFICLIIFPVLFSYAQEQDRIVTANEFLNYVTAQYGSINDYEAKIAKNAIFAEALNQAYEKTSVHDS